MDGVNLLNYSLIVSVNWKNVEDSSMSLKKFCVQSEMCGEVAMLRLFPGMTCSTVGLDRVFLWRSGPSCSSFEECF